MSARARRAIERHIDVVDIGDDAPLALRGSGAAWVTFVLEGELLALDPNGTRELSSGDMFGVAEALHNASYGATLRAKSRARVGIIDRRRFVGLLSTVPEFAAAVLRHVTSDVVASGVAAPAEAPKLRLVSRTAAR